MKLPRNGLARLITKLSDAQLAERREACTLITCSDAELVKLLDDEAYYRETRKAG